jgi:hypothetical protein
MTVGQRACAPLRGWQVEMRFRGLIFKDDRTLRCRRRQQLEGQDASIRIVSARPLQQVDALLVLKPQFRES